MYRNKIMFFLVLIVLVPLVQVDALAQTCDSLSFEVTAELTDDPGYEGMYKYAITGYWGLSGVEQGGGLSYFLFPLGVHCPCLCDSTSEEIYFPDPAGTSTGIDDITEEPCEAVYLGFVECNGLEDITNDDVIKYEASSNTTCFPIAYGNGTWVFYSTMPPLPWNEYPDAVIVKYGEMICTGDITGQLPSCTECIPVPTENSSWGQMKSIYK